MGAPHRPWHWPPPKPPPEPASPSVPINALALDELKALDGRSFADRDEFGLPAGEWINPEASPSPPPPERFVIPPPPWKRMDGS